ncbi:type I restriction-modification system subunit M [Furfurilactobacillus milii]|uniref:site-specific DNA-methyltransferase (adenine-specific) n=1 Tax=Furfurilactobacillus milii TaxID=2888272 RepID=A0A6N9I3M1_9LACO|nr:type I restriction-modification system subunit M [Furfurilactobacillus milii]MYV17555.1 type I restriction-modification system subunit M [Furfurilactobacillus milii]
MSEDVQTIQQIESKLWAMANELRGSMDASEYKNYILAFMFYRFLSENQEKYLQDSEIFDIDEANGETINDAYLKATEVDGVADYLEDISQRLGYAIKPEDTWATLVGKVMNGEVAPSDYQTIFDDFNSNSELNRDAASDFRGVFDDVNLGDSRLGNTTTSRAKSLNKVVTLVNEISYTDESGHDILGDIYEYLIGQFAANAGKKGGEFYTPHEVSQVLAKLVTHGVEVPDNEQFSVYDPTMGSGSLLLTVQQELPGGKREGAVSFYGQELSTTTYNLARMNLMMRGVEYSNMSLNNADTLEVDWPDGPDSQGIDHPRMFDAVVANPPYSADWDNNERKLKDPRFSDYGKLAPSSKADYAFVLHSLYHLNEQGTMAIVLPHGVLFRGAAEGKIREALIKKNYLDGVIGLPANLFYGTSIPTTVLVFKKNKASRDIMFIDASSDFEKDKNQNRLRAEDINKIAKTYFDRKDVEKYAHVATLKEVEDNEYNLNIPRYVDTFEEEPPVDVVALKDDYLAAEKESNDLQAQVVADLEKLVGKDDAAAKDLAALIEALK